MRFGFLDNWKKVREPNGTLPKTVPVVDTPPVEAPVVQTPPSETAFSSWKNDSIHPKIEKQPVSFKVRKVPAAPLSGTSFTSWDNNPQQGVVEKHQVSFGVHEVPQAPRAPEVRAEKDILLGDPELLGILNFADLIAYVEKSPIYTTSDGFEFDSSFLANDIRTIEQGGAPDNFPKIPGLTEKLEELVAIRDLFSRRDETSTQKSDVHGESSQTEGVSHGARELNPSRIDEVLSAARSFEDVYAYLAAHETFEVEGVTYPSASIRDRVEGFRVGTVDVDLIPDVPGLRDRAQRLFANEQLNTSPTIATQPSAPEATPEMVPVYDFSSIATYDAFEAEMQRNIDADKTFTHDGETYTPEELAQFVLTHENVRGVGNIPGLRALAERLEIKARIEQTPLKPTKIQTEALVENAQQENSSTSFENIHSHDDLYAHLNEYEKVGNYTPSYFKMLAHRYRIGDIALGAIPDAIPGLRGAIERLGRQPIDPVEAVLEKREDVAEALSEVEELDLRAARETVLDAHGIPGAERGKWGAAVHVGDEEILMSGGYEPVEVVTPTDPVEMSAAYKAFGLDAEGVPHKEEKKTIEEIKRQEVLEDFETKFNIRLEDLAKIEGYNQLSHAQRELVLENLAQLTVGRIETRTQEAHTENSIHERANRTVFGSKFLGRAWVGLRETFMRKNDLLIAEKEEAATLRAGGMAVHGEVLRTLVHDMVAKGPEAVYNENGEIVVSYARSWEGIDAEGEEILSRFNSAAYAQSRTPYEDQLLRSQKELKRVKRNEAFSHALSREDVLPEWESSDYVYARNELIAHLERKGMLKKEIYDYVYQVDGEVRKAQFIQTTPDALKALEDIEDPSVWKAALASIGAERSIAAAGGAVARTVGSWMFGYIAAPLVAAGIGGIRGWNRGKAELREHARAQRRGIEDESVTALNMVKADGERGAIAKLGTLFARFDENQALIAGYREVNAGPEAEAAEREQEKILTSLKERLEYTEDKLRLGLINFGTTDALAKQYELMQVLTEAKMRLVNIESTGETKVQVRLASFLAAREDRIGKAQRDYKIKKATDGALLAGSFAILGSLIGEMFSGGKDVPGTIERSGIITPQAPQSDSESVIENVVRAAEEAVSAGDNTQRVVKAGDTVTGIFRTEIPEIAALTGGRAQETAVANFIESLSEAELKEAGIRSGNVDLIRIGETLDITKLKELYGAKIMK